MRKRFKNYAPIKKIGVNIFAEGGGYISMDIDPTLSGVAPNDFWG